MSTTPEHDGPSPHCSVCTCRCVWCLAEAPEGAEHRERIEEELPDPTLLPRCGFCGGPCGWCYTRALQAGIELTAFPSHLAPGPGPAENDDEDDDEPAVRLLPAQARGAPLVDEPRGRHTVGEVGHWPWATVYETVVVSGEDPPTREFWDHLGTVDGQTGWILGETWSRSVGDDATTHGEMS